MSTINNIYASAWEAAIINTGRLLSMDPHYAITQWSYVQAKAEELGLEFDNNGKIVGELAEFKED
jgi:hypothetical protein